MRGPLVAAIVLALLSSAAPARADARGDAVASAASYLVSRQQPSGAFVSADQPADMTAEYVVSLVAADANPDAVARALGHIRVRGREAVKRAGHAGRIVSGLVAAGADPRAFGGVDYVALLRSYHDPATGSYDTGSTYANALAVLGLLAGGEPVGDRTLTYMSATRCPGGGWSHSPACAQGAEVDSTAMVVSALLAAGSTRGDEALVQARSYLAGSQREDGGWGVNADGRTNANSTSLALSALSSLGEDPTGWRKGGRSGIDALLSLQMPSGGIRYTQPEQRPNDYATAQAVVGLALKTYPVRPVPRTGGTGGSADDADKATPRTRTSVRAAQGDGPTTAQAQTPGPGRLRVGLMVRGTDEHTLCPEIEEGSTGYEVLTSSGLPLEVQPFGPDVFVCSIDGTGCGTDRCTDCERDTFWGYWTRDAEDASWAFSQVGSTDRTVRAGSADAWVWGRDGGPPPGDEVTAETLCSSAPSAEDVTPRAARPEQGRGSGPVAAAALASLLALAGSALVWRRRRMVG